MFNTKTSKRMAQSKLTLVIVLVIFLCQIFENNISFSIQFPVGEHLLSTDFAHHHGHADEQKIDLTQSEHDHSNDCHNSCHPPVELAFKASQCLSDMVSADVISYQNCNYAPPIPPPNA